MNAEKNTNPISWLHGLQDYLEFTGDLKSKTYVDFLLSLMYANNGPIINNENLDMKEFVHHLRKYANNPILDIFYKYFRMEKDPISLQDAFSRGQVNSKIWAMDELLKIKKDFDTVYVLGGWYGQIRLFLEQAIKYNKIRIFDCDTQACVVSDKIFNFSHIQDYKVKSVEMKIPMMSSSDDEKNMSWITRTGCTYNIKNYSTEKEISEKTQPDLIFNTSAEHMPSIWYQKFLNRPMESDPLFVIQSNNLFGVDEHVNCVHSIDHMCKKFPMSRLEYAGEQELFGYKRFMVIGRL